MTKMTNYLYQHMDSRGGSTLIRATTKEIADRIYCGVFAGTDEPTDEDMIDHQGSIEEDFEGPIDMILAPGTKLPHGYCQGSMGGVELMRSYGGEYVIGIERESGEDGRITKLYIVHVGADKPSPDADQDAWEQQKLRDAGFPDEITGLGEDAFGCILMREVGIADEETK